MTEATRFEPDFTEVTSTIKIWPRADYELKINGAKPFAYTREEDEQLVAGVTYNFELVGRIGNDGSLDTTDEGEICVPARLYVHSKKGWGFTKGVLMAFMGYDAEHEEEFNKAIAELDFTLDPGDADDEGEFNEVEAGGGWQEPVGSRVRVTLDKGMYNEREQQVFKAWRPVTS